MRIGYCSPFNPMKSGISDFSEELVQVLKDYNEIVIFSPVKPSRSEILNGFEWHLLSELDDEALRSTLDVIVYHVGNNVIYHGEIVDMLQKYPGIVELHEVGLHHLAAGQLLEKRGKQAYLELLRYCHGDWGVSIAEAFFRGEKEDSPWNRPLELCMNRHIIEAATGVIVHSDMVKQMVLGVRDDVPITVIYLHTDCISGKIEDWQRACREKLHLPAQKLIFGSFGFATESKRIIPTLDALQRFREKQKDFLYVIVGKAAENLNLPEEIKKRNLADNVKVTGFASLEDFKLYLGACDFCLNLRYPTQGESSASLHRMMGMGKPPVVTDIGTFSDYPDDVALKVRYDEHEVDDIAQAITLLACSKDERKKRGAAAMRFAAENCDLHDNAKKYAAFFERVKYGTWQPDHEDVLIGRLCELGLTDENYLAHIWEMGFSSSERK